MGYIACTTQIILLLAAYVCQVFAITTRLDHEVSPSRNFRRHIGNLPVPDWELGLREAVYQALLRERNLHPNLREFLYSAPIIGHQDTATPFGDIIILARGQLYSAPGGFQFVQDPYKNDCDECHNPPPRCDRAPCENWRPEGHERILALWTVKRIRHRDSNYGYRYELEYKVSPMNVPVDEPFVTRNGRFDYGMPGHTFIVKSNPRQYDSPYQNENARHDKVYRSPHEYNSNDWSPNFGPNFDGRYLPPPPLPPPPPLVEEYYDEDPRNNGYPNVLYGPPQIYTKKPPPYGHFTTRPPQTYDEEDEAERELFKKLFGALPTKTSTTEQASLSTASTQNIYAPVLTTKNSVLPTIPTTSKFLPTTNSQSSYHPTSAQAPLLPTIPIQNSFDPDIFQDKPLTTRVVPTRPSQSTIRFPTTISSRSTSPYFTNYKTTTTIRFPESPTTIKYSEPDPLYSNSVTPTKATSKLYPTGTTKGFKTPTRKFKTTPSDDYDIFGERDETEKQDKQTTRGMRFPGLVNNRVPPGEQVIKVVSAPTIITKGGERQEEPLDNIGQSESNKLSPRYQVNFNNTRQLQPDGETYITIGLNPSTRDRHTTTLSTLNTENSRDEYTTKAVVPQITITQQSSVEPSTTSTSDNSKLTTTRTYTTFSTENPTEHQETLRPFTKGLETSSTGYETIPFTRTTPQTTGTHPSTYTSSTSPSTVSTSHSSKATKPIFPSTRKYYPSTKVTSSTKGREPSTATTKPYLPSSAITTSTRGGPLTRKTVTPKQKIIPTRPVTRKYKPPTQSVETTIAEGTVYTSPTFTRTPTTTYSIPTSTIPSISTETTIISTTYIKDSEFTTESSVITTNIDISTSPSSISIPNIDSESTKPNIPSTLPITYTTPTKTSSELTTPISRTSVTTSSTVSTTKLTKTPPRASSSTTKATEDIFLQEDNHDVSKPPKPNPPRASSSTTKATEDIFLQEDHHDVSKPPKPSFGKDLDLDLFGEPLEKTTPKVSGSKTQQHKDPFNSKEIDDIFGSAPIKTQPVRDDYDYDNNHPTPSSTTNKVKIIYSGFFSPSTSATAERTTESNFKEKSKSLEETTTTMIEVVDSSEELKNKSIAPRPLTSQSYSTSVSVEVNKKNEMTTTRDILEVDDFESHPKEISLKNLTSTTPAPCNTTEKKEDAHKNKIFDMLALSVVNHAKSIDILNSNNEENSNNNNNGATNNNTNTVRERRYKRKRTYRVQKIRRRTERV